MQFYWMIAGAWLNQVEEFARPRGKKYQTSLIFSSRPLEGNFSSKICRIREETAELTASLGILLSSFLRVCGGLQIIRELKQRRRLRQRKRHFKIELSTSRFYNSFAIIPICST